MLQHLATRLQFLIISLKVITSTLQHQSVYCRGAPCWSFASSSAPGRNHGSRALKKKQRVDRLVIFPALGKIHKNSKNPKGAKFPSAPRLWNFSFMMDPFVTIFTTKWHVNTCDMFYHVCHVPPAHRFASGITSSGAPRESEDVNSFLWTHSAIASSFINFSIFYNFIVSIN